MSHADEDPSAAEDEYVVECYWPGVTADDVEELDRRTRDVVATAIGSSLAVHYVGSILVPGDEVVLFEFRAASGEIVAGVSRRAGIQFQRIVNAVRRSREA